MKHSPLVLVSESTFRRSTERDLYLRQKANIRKANLSLAICIAMIAAFTLATIIGALG